MPLSHRSLCSGKQEDQESFYMQSLENSCFCQTAQSVSFLSERSCCRERDCFQDLFLSAFPLVVKKISTPYWTNWKVLKKTAPSTSLCQVTPTCAWLVKFEIVTGIIYWSYLCKKKLPCCPNAHISVLDLSINAQFCRVFISKEQYLAQFFLIFLFLESLRRAE